MPKRLDLGRSNKKRYLSHVITPPVKEDEGGSSLYKQTVSPLKNSSVDFLEEQVKKLEEENARLKEKVQFESGKDQLVDDLKRQISGLEASRKKLQDDSDRKLATQQKLVDEIRKDRERVQAESQRNIQQIESEKEQLRLQLVHTTLFHNEQPSFDLINARVALQNAICQQKKLQADLQSKDHNLQVISLRCNQFQQQIQQMAFDLKNANAMKERNEVAVKNNTILSLRNAQQEKENTSLRNEINKLSESKTCLEAEVLSYKERCRELETQLANFNTSLSQKDAELDQVSRQIRDEGLRAVGIARKLSEEKASLLADNNAMKDIISKLRLSVSNHETTINTLEAKLPQPLVGTPDKLDAGESSASIQGDILASHAAHKDKKRRRPLDASVMDSLATLTSTPPRTPVRRRISGQRRSLTMESPSSYASTSS